jgi:hypothetical protein
MKFKGNGSVWNPSKNKRLVNFNKTELFETNDKNEIEILDNCDNVECVDSTGILKEKKEEKPTQHKRSRKDLIKSAKEAGIKGADRMKTEEIISLLEE